MEPISPGVLLTVAVIVGIGGAVTYTAFHYAERAEGKELKIDDLLPAPFPYLPLPRFLFTSH